MTLPAHRQASYPVRLEWGPTGAAAVCESPDGVDVAVVVDVLSFTTALSVAVERGTTVLPYPWKDERAAAHAAEHDAVLAVGRSRPGVSLSPASLLAGDPVERLVLPSPNGSTICSLLATSGATVVGASLRNASAVAVWLAPRLAGGARVALVPAGERWPDDTLRPAVEDLWGAGAVLAGLVDTGLSPEARLARDAYLAARPRLATELAACASGRELTDAGYPDDVRIAAELDASSVVPVLGPVGFRAG